MNDSLIFAEDVKRNLISNDLIAYATTHIRGSGTVIAPGVVLGEEGPVVLENCRLGRGVRLKGGFYRNAVFLDGSSMGSGAHIREGTLLEEQASGAHTVGLKQTILFPFVTTGSLINFCDAMIAGGTHRENHSEIGSSFVHFNYTPNQDKATPSLFGDVDRGVFLRERPIFLGGQGGAVGPLRVDYGTVLGAGSILRKDQLEPNRLIVPAGSATARDDELTLPLYRNVRRVLERNITYIAHLIALRAWYTEVRLRCVRDDFDRAIHAGAVELLATSIDERRQRLDGLIHRVDESHRLGHAVSLPSEERTFQSNLLERWKDNKLGHPISSEPAPESLRAQFTSENDYISTVQQLPTTVVDSGREWLQSIIRSVEVSAMDYD